MITFIDLAKNVTKLKRNNETGITIMDRKKEAERMQNIISSPMGKTLEIGVKSV